MPIPRYAAYIFFCALFFFTTFASAQSVAIAAFTVRAGSYDRLNTPVSVSLAGIAFPDSVAWQLVEHRGGERHPVAAQRDPGNHDALTWVLNGDTPAGSLRRYTLIAPTDHPPRSSPAVTAEDRAGSVVFEVGGKEALTYQYARAPVPDGVDEIYRRGGFIHPLRSLGGGTLTRVQPPDHYHHYGLWNPWTHTEYDGREIDFWNLAEGQGTVAAKGVTSLSSGPVFGELTAWHEYLAYQDSAQKTSSKKLLNELWDVRVWNSDPQQQTYLVDLTTTQTNVTDLPFTVKKYRYQGLGFRANKAWSDRTARLLTSEGKNKANGNGTRARWGDVRGPTTAGTSGVLFMTHPANFNFPEPIRIWPQGANDGQENVFFNFNPAQDRDWLLKPQQPYALKYRLLVYDGEIDSATAQRYWQDFADPPQVTVANLTGLAGKKLLLYTKNGEGYVHENIPYSIQAIQRLGDEHGFEVVASEDPALFTPATLSQFDVLVFSNTNNDIFDTPAQEKAFQEYMQSGGRFVAIHSACGSERDWPWFWRNLGGKFVRHPPQQNFDVKVMDPTHPSTYFLPDTWSIQDDECYYIDQLNPDIHVLAAADLHTVEDDEQAKYPGSVFGNYFPTTWCHTTDGGRQWYTSLGHRPEHYSDPQFLQHILGGITWVLSQEQP